VARPGRWLNIWVAPADSVAAGQLVTRTKGRPINWQDWSPDGRYIMFLNDENGDENLRMRTLRFRQLEANESSPKRCLRTFSLVSEIPLALLAEPQLP
jgi:Tol biopolymer transport system component